MSANILPKALVEAIDSLGNLPGVGQRTSERYAYFLLKANPKKAQNISETLNNLHAQIKTCPITFTLINSEEEVSPLYSDELRDKKTIAIVENPLDVVAIERTGKYNGTYHVLGGVISPIDGVGPEKLHIPELIKRIQEDQVTELIIATNASVEGESTALFLQRSIQDNQIDIKISRLARGIPIGVDLEYADQITLSHALEGRKFY